MSFDRSPAPTARPNRTFVLWCWTMLLVVLMSATPTSAHVRTRLVGSAFDPASVSVALSPKPAKGKILASARGSGLPDEPQDGRPIFERTGVPVGSAVLPAPLPSTLLPAPAPGSSAYSGLSPRAHGARAPPTA